MKKDPKYKNRGDLGFTKGHL